ncbi:MAG: hypothetical protein ACSLFK_12645 [Gemmatimonadaceae bacterium]
MKDSRPIDIEEIEQDIRDHVDAELADREPPISAKELDEVLQRLGSPEQWAADNGPASASQASSPEGSSEDWLAYASAGTMLLFLAFPPLLLVSWLMARWTLARIEERGEPLGTRRWLLYPPIVIVIAPLAAIGMLWVFAPFGEIGGTIRSESQVPSAPVANTIDAITIGLGGLGVYWIFVGLALAFGERAVRLLFYPFAEGFRRRHGWFVSGLGAAVAAAAAATFVFLGG